MMRSRSPAVELNTHDGSILYQVPPTAYKLTSTTSFVTWLCPWQLAVRSASSLGHNRNSIPIPVFL